MKKKEESILIKELEKITKLIIELEKTLEPVLSTDHLGTSLCEHSSCALLEISRIQYRLKDIASRLEV